MPKGYHADGTPIGRKRWLRMPGLRKLVQKGWRLKELSEHYGCSRQGVLSRIRAEEIPYDYDHGCPGERNGSWKGGITWERRRDRSGYWVVYRPDHPHARKGGMILESRIVMEEKLGRYLLPTEVVHHDDDDIDNNHPDNLFVYGSNGEHLAATLKGKVPKWSKAGFRKMQNAGRYVRTAKVKQKMSEAAIRVWRRRKKSNRVLPKNGDGL